MSLATGLERIAPIYPVADDPRLAWLPDDPRVMEAHVRATGAPCDLVVGYGGEKLAPLHAFVGRCLDHASERGERDHRATWQAWLRAGIHEVLDAGVQLGAPARGLQVYLRGRYSPPRVAEVFAAVDRAVQVRVVANALALFGAPSVEMIGLELSRADLGAAAYLAIPSGGTGAAPARTHRVALADTVAFFLAALLPGADAADAWRAISEPLLHCPMDEWIYVSFDPTVEPGSGAPAWVKVDVGERPLALAGALARQLGVDVAPLLALATAHELDPIAHLGIRFGPGAPAVSIYCELARPAAHPSARPG